MPKRPLETRLWEKVDVRDSDECWLWLGAQSGNGKVWYGQIRGEDGYSKQQPHRIVMELQGHDITELHVHHECRNTLCVNPAHLRALRCVDHMDVHRIWTRESVIEAIKQFAKTYGVAPAATDWNPAQARSQGHLLRVKRWQENDWPSFATVQDIFGSWSAGLRAAGFESGIGRRKRHLEMHQV